MDESLLGPSAARLAVTEEEDELWTARRPPPDRSPFGSGPSHHDDHDEGAAFLPRRAQNNATSAAPLPSLRAHVHLPAISSLFQGLAESAKSRLMGPSDGTTNSSSAAAAGSNTPDAHGRVASLDGFLITLYNYFYHKGFWSIAVVELVSLTTGLFSVSLSSFLLGCVEWRELLACQDDSTHSCKPELDHYIICRPAQPSLLHLAVAFYFTTFLIYWLFRVVRLVATLRDAHDMGAFYWQRLGIDERMLQTVTWDEVVTRVLGLVSPSVNVPRNLKQISSYRLQIDPSLLATPHDFARRIMRRENYLIAFMNHALFQDSKLLPPKLQFASIPHVVFSRNMEANLTICLIDQMFDAQQNLSLPVLSDELMMQKRFLVAGILNFALTPFILLYRSSHFLFQSSQEWHMHRALYFGSRRWSSYALWKFREYNELPHALEARMARSYPLAEKYISMFPAGLVAVIAGGISFCATSFMAVLVAMSLMGEWITFYDRPLIWYFTVTTGVLWIARSFTTSEASPFALHGDCEEAMLALSTETHYFPKEWRGNCRSYDVRDAFLALFPYKAVLFAQECLSVLMAPYILCVSLPSATRELLLFIRSHSLALPNVGAVCRFAEFDFKRYGNDMKMERSFVNFKQNHPHWVGAEEGEALVARLGRVKEEEMEMSMRLADTMLFNSNPSIPQLSMSQQLMQSQAIHTALGASYGRFPVPLPQENEFYWLEKLHQRGELGDDARDDLDDLRGADQDRGAQGGNGDDLSLSSVRV